MATTPSEGFFAFIAPHVNTVCCTLLYNTVYVLLLCKVEKKPREGILTLVFILGPVSMVADNTYICSDKYKVYGDDRDEDG
jgi:hypothetical protein